MDSAITHAGHKLQLSGIVETQAAWIQVTITETRSVLTGAASGWQCIPFNANATLKRLSPCR